MVILTINAEDTNSKMYKNEDFEIHLLRHISDYGLSELQVLSLLYIRFPTMASDSVA